MFFRGWGGDPDFWDSCSHHRADEMHTALRLVREINEHGADVAHLAASGGRRGEGAAVLDGLRGRLDVNALSLGGHSYGAATATSALRTPLFGACFTRGPLAGLRRAAAPAL